MMEVFNTELLPAEPANGTKLGDCANDGLALVDCLRQNSWIFRTAHFNMARRSSLTLLREDILAFV